MSPKKKKKVNDVNYIRNKLFQKSILTLLPLDFVDNVIFQGFSFPLQLEIQNFDIVCSPVWTSRDRCCDLPSMVSIYELEAVQNVNDIKYNNINISLH